jgi:hypothetical protein
MRIRDITEAKQAADVDVIEIARGKRRATPARCVRTYETPSSSSARRPELLEHRGRVLEVISESGQRRFRVLWEDGSVIVIDPSRDAIVVRAAS